MRRRVFTNAERGQIVRKVNRLVAQGKSGTEACEEAGIATSQYYKWRMAQNSVRNTRRTKRTYTPIKALPYQAPYQVVVKLADGVFIEGRIKVSQGE